jgi:sialate O-acetylesterase
VNSVSRYRRAERWVWLLVLPVLLAPLATASAQETPKAPVDRPPLVLKLKQPVSHQVYQRDREGQADIPVTIDNTEGAAGAKIVGASIAIQENTRFEDGKLLDVPAGGPYSVTATVKIGDSFAQVQVDSVFVGDLWVLAGQSNMEGYGNLSGITPPHPQVSLLGMNGEWSQAQEPLHWLVDSPDPVHSGNSATREKRSADQHKQRRKGAGLGLPFASTMVNATGVPVGLIACAHGGTSMAQWDPAKKGDGGKSLYGSMLRQIKLAEGQVKGVLWYQGESDANPQAVDVFAKAFADLIAAVRADLDQLELPFYYVQIGRVVRGGDSKAWNTVQDVQRRLADQVPNTAVVSVIDLELDDGIHVGTQGLKRAGHRLAKIAQRELFGQIGAMTPTFDRVTKGAANSLLVRFKGVNIGPGAPGGMAGQGTGGMMMSPSGAGFRQIPARSPVNGPFVGLKPLRHIAGFSLHKEDGAEIPLIFDAAVGNALDTVILKLNGALPAKAYLWYGYGFDPYCNLADSQDMAVPVFGPIPLDETR